MDYKVYVISEVIVLYKCKGCGKDMEWKDKKEIWDDCMKEVFDSIDGIRCIECV
jgi:DNA-directed RNA polymerase subunit RPC12/RpoP